MLIDWLIDWLIHSSFSEISFLEFYRRPSPNSYFIHCLPGPPSLLLKSWPHLAYLSTAWTISLFSICRKPSHPLWLSLNGFSKVDPSLSIKKFLFTNLPLGAVSWECCLFKCICLMTHLNSSTVMPLNPSKHFVPNQAKRKCSAQTCQLMIQQDEILTLTEKYPLDQLSSNRPPPAPPRTPGINM